MTAAIDAALHAAMGDVPGAVALATDGRGTLYEGAFGVRRLGAAEAMTPDTIFWIASLSKALTTVAAMQLVEQGRVALDQPLGAAVPKLAGLQVLDGFGEDGQPRLRPARREVTLHDLLTHTSGFGYDFISEDLARYAAAAGRPAMASGLNAALEAPLLFDPGERWEYGIGVDWAGKVVEAVSGQTLGAYLAQHVTGPLGMADTRFGCPDSPRLAAIHHRLPDGALRPGGNGQPAAPELESGGGGLYSTARDYGRLLAMLLRGGDGLLRPETVAAMGRDQLGGIDASRLRHVMPPQPPGMSHGWGYGFALNGAPGHAGRSANSLLWSGLANCYYWIDPARQVAGVLMAQVLPFADPAVLALLDAFEREVYRSG